VLKRISLLSLEKFKGVILKFSPDVLELKYMNPEVGEGRERLAVKLQHLILEGDSGEAGVAEAEDPEANLDMPFEIGYNARYLMEPLNAIKSDEVYLEIFKKNKPCRIVGADDPHYYSIIMPMDLEK
jgi:DNA polymerase-3 subunit beta